MEGVTQIPESQLPVRHDRTENTALRPSDPNDPKRFAFSLSFKFGFCEWLTRGIRIEVWMGLRILLLQVMTELSESRVLPHI